MKNPEPNEPAKRLRGVRSAAERRTAPVEIVVGDFDHAEPGHQPTFPTFYRDTFPEVARALAITLGDDDLGNEAAAEAMARAYARWGQVSVYENPAGWVYRVGLNWARSVRRRLRFRGKPPATEESKDDALPDPDLHDALTHLTIDLRSVVVCRLLLDWSTERTATALGIPQGTVKSRLSRALEDLERRLTVHGEED